MNTHARPTATSLAFCHTMTIPARPRWRDASSQHMAGPIQTANSHRQAIWAFFVFFRWDANELCLFVVLVCFFSTLLRKLLWNWDRFSVFKGSKSQSVSELLHWLMGNISNLWVKSKFGYFSAWDRSWNMWWLRQDYCTWLWSCVALVFLLWACLGLKEQFNILRSKHIDFSPQS